MGRKDRVPAWARVLTEMEHRAFLSEVQLCLASLELEASLEDGVVTVAREDGPPIRIGLQNLAQICKQTSADRWPTAIQSHFAAVLGAEAESRTLDRRSYAAVRSRLKVRLYPETALADTADAAVVRQAVAPGIVAVLAYDLPSTVLSVAPDDLAFWGRAPEALFEIGLANVLADQGVVRDRMPVERGLTLRVLRGESHFVASHLLLLREHVPMRTPFGVLVTVPTRELLLYHVIEDARVLMAINLLIPYTYYRYVEGPGSLSSRLYWWREGRITWLPTEVSSTSVQFAPPEEFVEQVIEPLGVA